MSVYLIATEDYRFVKIGRANVPSQRLHELQVGCPFSLELMAVIDATMETDVEKYFHKKFSAARVRGEWFSICATEILQHVLDVNGVLDIGRHDGKVAYVDYVKFPCSEYVWHRRRQGCGWGEPFHGAFSRRPNTITNHPTRSSYLNPI